MTCRLFLFLNVAQLATINVQQATYVSSLVAPITLITIWRFLMSLRQLRHRQDSNENTEMQGTYPQSTSIEEPDPGFLDNMGAPLEFAADASDVDDSDDTEDVDLACIGVVSVGSVSLVRVL